MAVSVADSGSQTCTISTEHTLATITAAGVYCTVLDLSAAADGDVFLLRVYGKARSTDSERLSESYSVGPMPAGSPLVTTLSRISPHHYRITITQTAGTGRAVPWAVYSTGV